MVAEWHLVLLGIISFVCCVLDQWPAVEASGNRNLVFHIPNHFLSDSRESSAWTSGTLCNWNNLLPGWNFLQFEFFELWQLPCLCEATVYLYMEKKILLHHVVGYLGREVELRGLGLLSQLPTQSSGWNGMMLTTPDLSILFNRDLEKAGMWQYSDFLLEKAKKQERLSLFSGEQPGYPMIFRLNWN